MSVDDNRLRSMLADHLGIRRLTRPAPARRGHGKIDMRYVGRIKPSDSGHVSKDRYARTWHVRVIGEDQIYAWLDTPGKPRAVLFATTRHHFRSKMLRIARDLSSYYPNVLPFEV